MTNVEKYLEHALRDAEAKFRSDEAVKQIKKEVDSITSKHICFSCVKPCKESLITGQLAWCQQYSNNLFTKLWYWLRSFI